MTVTVNWLGGAWRVLLLQAQVGGGWGGLSWIPSIIA